MINTKIEEILETFGMSGVKAAEIMGMSADSFRQKKREANYNKFNEQNLIDLVAYIKKQAGKLK